VLKAIEKILKKVLDFLQFGSFATALKVPEKI
jgi:hypothetical protein